MGRRTGERAALPELASEPGDDARTGQVHYLAAPLTAEVACDQVRAAIDRAALRPGQALSLRALADQHRVRVDTLAMMLRGLERDHLLTIRGDTAIVAPLDPDKLTEAQKFSGLIERGLIPIAFRLMTPAQLDKIEALIPTPEAVRERNPHRDTLFAGARLIAALYEAGSTPADQREIQALINHGKRYIAHSRLHTPWTMFAGQRHIVSLLRVGKTTEAIQLQLTLLDQLHDYERVCLDYPHGSDDDYPVADVLPLRGRRRRDPSQHLYLPPKARRRRDA
ncbi:MAG TPA: hypothetical protein VGM60_20880 [Pseudonocardia sp.]|uniref:hypothetical protein n=1 Tax=Pseudonocardia sp. TaxID=60912 RepID=UPI002F42BC63